MCGVLHQDVFERVSMVVVAVRVIWFRYMNAAAKRGIYDYCGQAD